VICPKESGNTYSVCQYICSNSESELTVLPDTAKINLACYDIIILASGVYANRVHKNILEFVKSVEADALKPEAKIHMFLH
ncbi:hypothetical protein EOM09_09110, partial [bacterium]|nr:hypothetical protein [bacterium]